MKIAEIGTKRRPSGSPKPIIRQTLHRTHQSARNRRVLAGVQVSAGIEQLDHAVRTAGAISHGVEGSIRTGLHSPIAGGFLADLRHRFRTGYSIIEQVIIEGRSSETIALLRDGKLDVAFVVGAVQAPDCHSPGEPRYQQRDAQED